MQNGTTIAPYHVANFADALRKAQERNRAIVFRIDGKGDKYRMTLDGTVEALRKDGIWQAIY